jgi:hypothetical protein
MGARSGLTGLAVSIVAVGVCTALLYRSAAVGVIAAGGAVILLAVAVGVAWASGWRNAERRN